MIQIITGGSNPNLIAESTTPWPDARALAQAISTGYESTGMAHLPQLPPLAAFEEIEGVVIGAVSARKPSMDVVLMRKNTVMAGQIFKIPAQAQVIVATQAQAIQLRAYRPDLQISIEPDPLVQLETGTVNTVLVPQYQAQSYVQNEVYEVIVLHPAEFTPEPGQGVMASLVHKDDIATRRELKSQNHPDVMVCTNVERTVLQLTESGVGVYCQFDPMGHYKVFGALEIDGEVRRAHLSSSTHMGLGERLAAMLKG
jgi:porphobilinogen deaminase